MPTINLNISKQIFCPIYLPYLYDYSKRYNVYYGGRASGKTKFIMQKLLIKGLRERRTILLMRKQTTQLRDSVWKEMLQTISDFHLLDYFSINKTEFRITCNINGTEFKCLGLDEPEKIKGFADISDVFMDEVTGFNKEDVELIDGTLRSPKFKLPLQMYFAFNPISKANFVYTYFGFDTGIVPPNTFILKSTYLDNPFLGANVAERYEALKQRDYQRWQIEALGDFVSLDRLVFQNVKVEEFNHADIKGQLICGLDYGFVNDISAFVASLLDEENKKLYVFKIWGDTNKTNQELANIIKAMGFGKSVIIADCAEQKSIEEMRREGIIKIKPSVKGADSIIHGIQKLQQYEIIVHPDCEGIITEFQNYAWQKDKQSGEYINKPIDAFNHYIDALRYSLQSAGTGKLVSLPRDVL